MTILLLLTTGVLFALAISAVRIARSQPDIVAAQLPGKRDIFVPKNGDKGLISCFEIPGCGTEEGPYD